MDEATKDSLNAVSILNKVYESTEDNTLREEELQEFMELLESKGKKDLVNILSGMHIKEGASDEFSVFASTFNLDSGVGDSTKFSSSGEVKTYRDERTQTKAENLSSELSLDLNTSIDKYNQMLLITKENEKTLQEKRDRREVINQELDEYQSVISEADDRNPVFQQEYWSRLNPIGMMVGGKTARIQTLQDNPDLVSEKRKLDDEIYQSTYGPSALHRDDVFNKQFAVTKDEIQDIINSLNIIEGDQTKTQLQINEDGTYKNIKGN
tara:strand:+ start:4823 stop:5623 length:801 start_codon:yes stop_codon:yes gene_type:complete